MGRPPAVSASPLPPVVVVVRAVRTEKIYIFTVHFAEKVYGVKMFLVVLGNTIFRTAGSSDGRMFCGGILDGIWWLFMGAIIGINGINGGIEMQL